MPRTSPLGAIQPTASISRIQNSQPQVRKALDVLVLTMGDEMDCIQTWEHTCEDTGLNFGDIALDRQEGNTSQEKLADSMDFLRDLTAQGKIDGSTIVIVLGHGGHEAGGGLSLASADDSFVIEDAEEFLRQVRHALAPAPDQPWEGLINMLPCGSGVMRETFKDSPGHLFFLSGRKLVLREDATQTVDYMLRAWAAETRSGQAPNPGQMRRLWAEAKQHTGEHISWSGKSKTQVHKINEVDLNQALPTKRQNAMYAKLSHGSLKSLKQVFGKSGKEMLSKHRLHHRPPLVAVTGRERQCAEKIKLLVSLGEDVKGADGKAAVKSAVDYKNPVALQTLIELGADPWAHDSAWQFVPDSLLARIMIDPIRPAPKSNPDAQLFPLHAAGVSGDLSVLEQMRPDYAAIAAAQKAGDMALAMALYDDHSQKISVLVGALKQKDADGNTPLGVALLHGQVKMIEALLNAQADAGCTLGNGETLLDHAVTHGLTDAVRLLGRYASARDAPPDNQMPLLIRALHAVHAGRAGMELIDALLEKDTVNTPAKTKALLYACHLDDVALVKKLINIGADLRQEDGNQRSALDLIKAKALTDDKWKAIPV